MGCRQSQEKPKGGVGPLPEANGSQTAAHPPSKRNGSTAGVVGELSSLGADCDKTCQKLGVSSKQIFSLRQSWKGIRRNMENAGIEMFVRLFKSNSDLKKMFHAFKDLHTDDELRSNEALENHATLVMTTLDEAITHIDNFDYVTEVLRKTGASHVRFEGFKSENFWNIRDPFLEAVKITLGDRYTDNMESIYKVAITFILQTMCDGMEEALSRSGASKDNAPHSAKGANSNDHAHSAKGENSLPTIGKEENS